MFSRYELVSNLDLQLCECMSDAIEAGAAAVTGINCRSCQCCLTSGSCSICGGGECLNGAAIIVAGVAGIVPSVTPLPV